MNDEKRNKVFVCIIIICILIQHVLRPFPISHTNEFLLALVICGIQSFFFFLFFFDKSIWESI